MIQQSSQSNLDIPDDEIGVVRDLRKKRPLNIKSFAIAFFVVVLIISSFWISFFVGKALLTPVKKLPDVDFQKLDERFSEERIPLGTAEAVRMMTRESTAVYESLPVPTVEVKDAAVPEKKEMKRQDPFTPEKKIDSKPQVKAYAPKKKTPLPASVFRVRSSIFDTREKAAELLSKLGDSGFEGFTREESSGSFSVQVGVFKSRSNAERLVQQLKDKGFEGEIQE